MLRARLPRHLCALATGVVITAMNAHARAATFHVNPVVLTLARGVPSTQLEIENESDDVVRFQASVYTWDQTATDELKLTPTDTLIAFPTLFSIEPHKKRTMRLGLKRPAATTEETYRVIVEQLGDVRDNNASTSTGVKMLTRMSMPLFTEIDRAKPSAALTGVALARGLLTWETQNTGNVHITPRSVRIVGRDANGAVVFQDEHKAWYVLRGRAHHNEVEVPNELCKKLTGIELMLNADRLKAGATITVTPQQCSG
jgi:fimbrial chaperone protein